MTDSTTDLAKQVGPLGAEAMEALWAAPEPLTVRAVLNWLNRNRAEPLAYTTVMTVLTRLAERGAATRTPAGRGYVYQAAVADAAELAVRDVVRSHGDAAVTHFVNQAQSDPSLLRRLEKLLQNPPAEPRAGSTEEDR